MRIGLYATSATGLEGIVGDIAAAERLGLDSAFFPQLTAWDALTVAAVAGQRVPRIGLGTAVVRTFAQHPLALAGQALTAQAATGGRLTLGIGPSHREIVEGGYGLSYDRPARHVREYLQALNPLLRGETVDFRGETLSAAGLVEVPGAEPPPVLVSALGPMMLAIAGELADGTVTVWAGPEVLGEVVVPKITDAASRAGRPAPRVVATAMFSVTAAPDRVRDDIRARFGGAGEFASYRRLLRQQGKAGIEDTVTAGTEDLVAATARRFAEAGVTDLLISPVGTDEERRRTLAFVARLS
ncbi:TIGR03564 family F420-dependent LLM class oxidoreductase [Amycolatopsis sp. SID8362]|uniref:TIGR03564 family F420-dependent LLM class oxidoreductase n=1 Tax=Amycolatopsis sp. SID8362 TaxID=2690346 RepID=UPI001371196F|nr:TIGR03564 family F420-dependent LLM class oxidoreductase [Amycolatopsis sp. SID8362]NBH06414.1 TIGR03564 family F420-dependent LLM class oxidoreductase [Amycolatopsis sp. SID8362]NED43112.1 TIGR03564 family F420-dependent LLM class oxidoreductase [Amycolatopsis sp. SID8362]